MTITSQIKKALPMWFAGAAAVAVHGHAVAEPLGDKTLRDSERMIARCLDYAASNKLPAMSIGVIDASGTLVAFKRQDGASSATADAALLKARTALRLNAPTAVLGPAVAEDASTRDAFIVMQMTTIPGGVPIADPSADREGRAVGAVGVSGGAPEQDAACAEQALKPEKAR